MEQRHVYGGVIAATGLLLAGVQTAHGLEQFDSPIAIAVGVLPFVALALAVTYAGYWMVGAEQYETDVPRITAWALGGTVVFASIAALVLFGGRVATGSLDRASVVAIDHITAGVLSGTLVGLYDAQSRLRLRELRDERDRTEAFAEKATDLNNYGRAIAQSDGVEGIAAFCIEAVATLLDLREAAFVEVTDDGMYFVSNTVVGTGSDSLVPLVEAALEREPGTVVVHEGGVPAVDFGRTVETALTVHVTEREGYSAVLLALADERRTVGEEDRQLLELLVSHASMALERAASRPDAGAAAGREPVNS